MLNYEKNRIEKALDTVRWAGRYVLLDDYYEECELKQLKRALSLLLEEAEKK